jgi:hypothetical protein
MQYRDASRLGLGTRDGEPDATACASCPSRRGSSGRVILCVTLLRVFVLAAPMYIIYFVML